MLKLFPSEQLVLEAKSDPTFDERKKSRYILVIGIIFILVAIFYRYASAQDWILSLVFYFSTFAAIISLGLYFYKIFTASKGRGKRNYYITSTRLVETDDMGKINREILLNKIKRIEVNLITGKAGDVIINPRDLSPQEDYKNRLKGRLDKQYAKDTFVVKSIAKAEEFSKALSK